MKMTVKIYNKNKNVHHNRPYGDYSILLIENWKFKFMITAYLWIENAFL